MSTIAGIPYVEAQFDKNGAAINQVSIPAGTKDLIFIAHGWRNDANDAKALYTQFFTNFAKPEVVKPERFAGRSRTVIGVFWPSKNFDALVAAQGGGGAHNTAGVGDSESDAESRKKLIDQLEALKAPGVFDEPAQQQALSAAQALVPDLDNKATARAAFMQHLRSLMDPAAADAEDASDIFLTRNPEDIFKRLSIPPGAVDPKIPKTGKALSLDPDARPVTGTGHAAGFFDIFKGPAAAGINVASYLSYYLMKERAGAVGAKGVAPLMDKLAPEVERIHLIGHSFGGRLIAAAAMASKTDKLYSASFLQAAFSHNGFSPSGKMNGYFRPVIESKRVKGAIIATHTKNDSAVGTAYPLASRISGTVAAALGDENDKYGGLGRNGAQQMNEGEVIKGQLQKAGANYQFTPGKIHNLLGDTFIANHGAVTGPEVATAVSYAIY